MAERIGTFARDERARTPLPGGVAELCGLIGSAQIRGCCRTVILDISPYMETAVSVEGRLASADDVEGAATVTGTGAVKR